MTEEQKKRIAAAIQKIVEKSKKENPAIEEFVGIVIPKMIATAIEEYDKTTLTERRSLIIKGYDETFDTDMIVKLGVGSELLKDNRINGILAVNQHGQSFGLGSYQNKQQLEDVFAALSEMFIDSDTKIFTMPKPIKNER